MKTVTSISATIILTSVVGFVSWGLLNAYPS